MILLGNETSPKSFGVHQHKLPNWICWTKKFFQPQRWTQICEINWNCSAVMTNVDTVFDYSSFALVRPKTRKLRRSVASDRTQFD